MLEKKYRLSHLCRRVVEHLKTQGLRGGSVDSIYEFLNEDKDRSVRDVRQVIKILVIKNDHADMDIDGKITLTAKGKALSVNSANMKKRPWKYFRI